MSADPVTAITAYGLQAGSPLALVVAPSGTVVAADDRNGQWFLDQTHAAACIRAVDDGLRPRWVWWSAHETVGPLLPAGETLGLRACWDLAAVHRLLHGGWRDDPARVWAAARGLRTDGIPRSGQLDLLGSAGAEDDDGDPAEAVRPDGHLRPDWAGGAWRADAARTRRWAALALAVQAAQAKLLAGPAPGSDRTLAAKSESAAALLAVELASLGLPVDRAAAEELLGRLIGPRPADEPAARQARAERDNRVLSLAPTAAAETDLRNPAQVRSMLALAGVDVPDTRSWRLERLANVHPLVPALVAWRKTERVATTYGYDWLDRHVGPDGRLRGGWTASDGGAGRMTAQTGLHNLPAEMRVAVAAPEGDLLVRADLGQVEPRVLAAVSGDSGLAAAASADDLYLPVAHRLGCTRDVAKVAVLAAMYGQTSGVAGQALAGMKASYRTAIRYLDDADAAGREGREVRTYGGRLVGAGRVPPLAAGAGEAAQAADRSAVAGRGRYLRNAVVQGAAAELFKAWAATVRAELLDSRTGNIVLCLHDELLLQVRADDAERVAASLVPALERTAARWFRAAPVRFVASVLVVQRWSDAKG